MSDLGTISILVDVQGRPVINQLATDLDKVAVAENKVSKATQEVINNFRSLRAMQDMAKRSTDDLSNSFTRLSNKDLQNASNALANYETTLANSRRGMGRFGVVTQQAGYQIGDFLVQVQSGTNWMVAFGQQATQLVGVLPMMTGFMGLSTTALIGLSAGLGIAIPLITALGAAFMRTTEQVENSADRQKQAYDSVIESIQQLRLERQMEASGAQSGEEQSVLNQINKLLEERASIQSRLSQLQNAGGRAAGYAQEKQDQMELLQLELDKNQAAIDALNNERQIEIATRRRANEQRNAYREATSSADRLYGQLLSIADLDISGAFTSAMGPLNSLIQGASALYTRMAAVAYLKSNATGGASYLANQYSLYGQGRVAGEQAARESSDLYTPFPVPDMDNGGSGGRAEARLKKQIDLTKELTQVERDRQTVIRSVEGSLEDGFMAMVEGTASVKDAFKKMAYEVIKELYRVLVVQRLVGGISNSISLFGGPSTGSFGLPFGGANASGGSVMPGKSYLVGENGPELVVPRHSGTVVNANQTANGGGNGGGFTQNLTISVTGSDSAMVRAEVAKMIPQITNATKAAVIDARLRGGQMAAAFK